MRGLRLLLLLVLLPGLLLPAGLAWHLCRCAAKQVPACCAQLEGELGAIDSCCCCGGGKQKGQEEIDGGDPIARAHAPCACGFVAVPEREPAQDDAASRHATLVVACVPQPAVAVTRPSTRVRPMWIAASAKPPPRATRNLPLRI